MLPEEGVLIHGLYMEGCRWDMNSMMVVDSLPGELTSELPMLHLEPPKNVEAESQIMKLLCTRQLQELVYCQLQVSIPFVD